MHRYSDDGVDLGDLIRHTVLDRRRLLQGGAAIGAAGLGAEVLASCGATDAAEPRTHRAAAGSEPVLLSSSPQHGAVVPTPRHETVILDQITFTVFDSFNLFIPNGFDAACGLQQVCMEYLWYLNLATGKLQPWLATGWEYGKNFTQFTMHLNPKAHWNDGEPFTSKDVKFSMEMLSKNATLLNPFPSITGEAQSISTPDDHTMVVDLNTTDPRYHYGFICAIVSGFYVVPEHIWSAQDPTSFKNAPPVGTGPYKLKQANRDSMMYLWEKDPNYWNKGELDPAARYVAWRTAPVADSAIQEFKQGQTDCGGTYLLVKAAIDGGYKHGQITNFLDPCPRALLINCDPSRGSILSDHRARQAVSLLLDREKAAKSIWSPATAPATYPWAAYSSNKKWENGKIESKYPLSYNPKRAEKLLDEIGAKKGSDGKRRWKGKPLSFQIITSSGPPTGAEYLIGQMLAAELEKVGIGAPVKAPAGAVFSNDQSDGSYDIQSAFICGESLDPYQLYSTLIGKYYVPTGKPTANNQQRFKDSSFDSDVAHLESMSPTAGGARSVYDDCLEEWFKQQPIIPAIQTLYPAMFNTTHWKGWPSDKDLYQVPNNWWGQFMFVIGRLKPAGGSN